MGLEARRSGTGIGTRISTVTTFRSVNHERTNKDPFKHTPATRTFQTKTKKHNMLGNTQTISRSAIAQSSRPVLLSSDISLAVALSCWSYNLRTSGSASRSCTGFASIVRSRFSIGIVGCGGGRSSRDNAPGRGPLAGHDRQRVAIQQAPAPRHPSYLDNRSGRHINSTAPSIKPNNLAGSQPTHTDKGMTSVVLCIAGQHNLSLSDTNTTVLVTAVARLAGVSYLAAAHHSAAVADSDIRQ